MMFLVFGVVAIWIVVFGALAFIPLVTGSDSNRSRRARIPLELPVSRGEVEPGSPNQGRRAA